MTPQTSNVCSMKIRDLSSGLQSDTSVSQKSTPGWACITEPSVLVPISGMIVYGHTASSLLSQVIFREAGAQGQCGRLRKGLWSVSLLLKHEVLSETQRQHRDESPQSPSPLRKPSASESHRIKLCWVLQSTSPRRLNREQT